MFFSVFDEEMYWEYVTRLVNLQTLLTIKKQLGDVVDITDRYIGCDSCNFSNEDFIISAISVILSLDEQQEAFAEYKYWEQEEFTQEYPDLSRIEFEEIKELVLPDTKYTEIIFQLYKEQQGTLPFIFRKANHEKCHLLFDSWIPEWEYCEELIFFLIEVRKKHLSLEGEND